MIMELTSRDKIERSLIHPKADAINPGDWAINFRCRLNELRSGSAHQGPAPKARRLRLHSKCYSAATFNSFCGRTN